jgi:lysophospholipase L1-like esterase
VTGALWVLGDSWADVRSYNAYWWAPTAGYPQLLTARFSLGVINSGVSGSGYSAHAGLPTFPGQAAQGTGATATAVLVFGGLNDPWQGETPENTRAGAAATYALLRRLCPDALLIVAGPQWGAQPRTPELVAAQAVIESAARAAGAVYLDPSGWLLDRPELMLDPYHPGPDGHALIADRLAVELSWLLSAPPPGGPVPEDPGVGYPAPWIMGDAGLTAAAT